MIDREAFSSLPSGKNPEKQVKKNQQERKYDGVTTNVWHINYASFISDKINTDILRVTLELKGSDVSIQ